MIHYFTADQLTEDTDRYLRSYDDEVRGRIGPGYRWPIRMRDWELAQVMRAVDGLAPLDAVLDTGSYNTFLALWLARRARRVVASDLLGLRRRANLLRRVGLLPRKPTEPPFGLWTRTVTTGAPNVRLMTADLLKMPFADATFDCIASVSVIEHVPSPEKALSEMLRCLKPGGTLLLTTDCSPEGRPLVKGTRYFSRAQLEELFGPHDSVRPHPRPSFDRANWCYGRNEPIVTVFVRIDKAR